MRQIVHLSDLHFGRSETRTLKPLQEIIPQLKPNLVVVSGDLTQRARSHEFQAAKDFLAQLPQPQIVVPGNHDVPLYNLFARFFRPMEKYQRFITTELQPYYQDEEIAVLGLNTAHGFTFKGGQMTTEQIGHAEEFFCPLPSSLIKILVTHHPFDLPDNASERDIVENALQAMQSLARCQIDVLLSGHLHSHHAGGTATRYKIKGHSALVIHAGTATSNRTRGGHGNAFNLIQIEDSRITVQNFRCEELAFCQASTLHFVKSSDGWKQKPIATDQHQK